MHMKIRVYIKPGHKQDSLCWDGEQIVAKISAQPQDGQANRRLVRVMAEWLKLPKQGVQIVSGQTARHKTVQLDTDEHVVRQAIGQLQQLPKQGRLL